jgi:hypothetical protein
MGKLDEDRLNTELSKLGYESVTIKSVGKGVGGSRKVAVEANKLHAVDKEGADELYVPLPVSLDAEVDAAGHIRSVAGGDVSPAAIGEARTFVQGLRQRAEIEGLASAAGRPGRTTHRIEKDAQGRLVLRRARARRM